MAINYNDLAKEVFSTYPEAKFAGVVNVKGEIVAGGHKENVEQLLVGEEVKMSIHYSVKKRDTYANLEYKIGKERSAITEFEKAIIISVPVNSNELFLVRTDKGADYLGIVDFVHSKLNPQKYIRDEIKIIQNEIEELKNLNERKKLKKKKIVKRKTSAKKKPTKKKVVKRKPARKDSKPKRKTTRRR